MINFCKHLEESCSGTLSGMFTQFRESAGPLVLGHRGSRRTAPENTVPAFAAAADEGADGVELDVHDTSDGALVVIHDHKLERTTDRQGAVAAMTAAEVREADAGWAFADGHGGHPHRGMGVGVPLLDEVLDVAADRGLVVNVEVKGEDAGAPALAVAVAELVRGRDEAGRVFLSSFSLDAMGAAAEAVPEVSTALVCMHWAPLQALAAALEAGCRGLHPDLGTLTAADPAEVVAAAHDAGCWVASWTVNDPGDAIRLAAAGIDALITDVPSVVRAALG